MEITYIAGVKYIIKNGKFYLCKHQPNYKVK